MAVALIFGLAVVWLGHAILISRVMNKRGFHPLPWFMVPLLLGPAVWPLALIEALSGPPAPELLRRGERGTGALDVIVLFEADHVPEGVKVELQRLAPRCRRLALARVIKAGGPSVIQADAERFLKGITSPLQARDAGFRPRRKASAAATSSRRSSLIEDDGQQEGKGIVDNQAVRLNMRGEARFHRKCFGGLRFSKRQQCCDDCRLIDLAAFSDGLRSNRFE